jgi:hypothetical protein
MVRPCICLDGNSIYIYIHISPPHTCIYTYILYAHTDAHGHAYTHRPHSLTCLPGFLKIYNGTEQGHLCLNLAGRTTYRFRVCATNAQGTSAFSPVLEVATHPAVPPAPPVPVLAGRPQSRSLEISWTVSHGEDTEVADYTLLIRKASQQDFVQAFRGAAARCEVHSLEPGTEYHFCVHGTNRGGDGPMSPMLVVTTAPEAPAAPSALKRAGQEKSKTATPVLPGAVSLTWTAPSFVGGAAITAYKWVARCLPSVCCGFFYFYLRDEILIRFAFSPLLDRPIAVLSLFFRRVYAKPTDASEWRPCWQGEAAPALIAGLTPARPHELYVTAVNRAGVSVGWLVCSRLSLRLGCNVVLPAKYLSVHECTRTLNVYFFSGERAQSDPRPDHSRSCAGRTGKPHAR